MVKSGITLKEMAYMLDVSIATVSKALNDSSEISKPTKLRVTDLAKKHNYKRNITAYNLIRKRTSVIGIIVPEISSDFMSDVFDGITYEASKRKYKLMLCQTKNKYNSEVNSINALTDGSVDGLIVSASEQTIGRKKYSHLNDLVDENFPLVMFDKVIDAIDCDKVGANIFESSYNITTELVKSGKKKVGLLINSEKEHLSVLCKRGYINALKNNGSIVDEDLILILGKDELKNVKLIDAFVGSRNVDALVSVDERYAIEAIRSAQKNNMSIPNHLSIVTFNGDMLAKNFRPSITSVSQNGYLVGREAAKMLFKRIKQKNSAGFITKNIATVTKYRETSYSTSVGQLYFS